MLSLRINDIIFPLPQGFTIPYELVTNVLNIMSIEPSFTLPITVPATDEIKAFFGHPHELQGVTDLSVLYENAAILIDGNDYWQGVVELSKANTYNYRIHFRMASGFLTTLLSGTKLRKVFEEDSITLDGETYNVYTVEWVQWPKDDYRVYVNGALYSQANALNDPVSVLNQLAADLATHASIATAVFDAGTYQTTITTVPGVSLLVTAETFKAANSNSGPFEPDIEVPYDQTLPMTVTALERTRILLDPNNGAYVLPVMHLPNLYEDKVPAYTGFVNVQQNGEFIYDKPDDPADITTTIIPCITRRFIMTSLRDKFGLTLQLSQEAGTLATFHAHEFVPRPIDTEMYAAQLLAAFQITIAIADLLPDVTVGEWLRSLKLFSGYCSTFSFYERSLKFSTLNEILAAQPAHDWSPYLVNMGDLEQVAYKGLKIAFGNDSSDPEISDHAKARETFRFKGSVILEIDLAALNGISLVDDVYYVESRNAYFIRTDAGWSFHSHNLDAYQDGEGNQDISTNYQPLPDTLQTVDGQTMLMPVSQVVGYSIPLGLDAKDWTPRISIHRYLQQAQQGAYYSMSSIGTHKANGAPISHINGQPNTGNPALSLANHPYGIEKFYQSYNELLRQFKRVEATFHLPKLVLEAFNHTDKVLVNGAAFLVEQISSELSEAGLGLAGVNLIKVP